jgi:hypothetical protein
MPLSYTKSPQSVSVKWSASHVPNNLTLYRSSDSRRSTIFGVSHKSGFAMVDLPFEYQKTIEII